MRITNSYKWVSKWAPGLINKTPFKVSLIQKMQFVNPRMGTGTGTDRQSIVANV